MAVPVGWKWLTVTNNKPAKIASRRPRQIRGGAARIHTKRGLDWTSRMPGIAQPLSALKLRSAVIDGEAIMSGSDGAPGFFALHEALAKGSAPDAILMLFSQVCCLVDQNEYTDQKDPQREYH